MKQKRETLRNKENPGLLPANQVQNLKKLNLLDTQAQFFVVSAITGVMPNENVIIISDERTIDNNLFFGNDGGQG